MKWAAEPADAADWPASTDPVCKGSGAGCDYDRNHGARWRRLFPGMVRSADTVGCGLHRRAGVGSHPAGTAPEGVANLMLAR